MNLEKQRIGVFTRLQIKENEADSLRSECERLKRMRDTEYLGSAVKFTTPTKTKEILHTSMTENEIVEVNLTEGGK